jgi:hypothetical protein
MAKLKITCQICKEFIGEADPEILVLPINGTMFHSPDPFHGFPPPFAQSEYVRWEEMRCPYCRQRPFLSPEEVMTTDGLFLIKPPESPEPPQEAAAGILRKKRTSGNYAARL